jgi:hypothetical protein
MWSVTRENLDKTRKVNVNFTIDKHLYEQFKRVAQKDMRKYSNIVEGSIRRYMSRLNYNLFFSFCLFKVSAKLSENFLK